jgi:hypothetical protein
MKVIDPGHYYELNVLDGDLPLPAYLRFVKREGPGYPGNKDHYPGTTCQIGKNFQITPSWPDSLLLQPYGIWKFGLHKGTRGNSRAFRRAVKPHVALSAIMWAAREVVTDGYYEINTILNKRHSRGS